MGKHIAFFAPSFKIGGVERAFVTLANSFVEDGHKVDFIVIQNEGKLKGELDGRISVIDFNSNRLRGSFIKLLNYLKETSADCLITGQTYLSVMSLICNVLLLKRVKIVVTQHSYQDVEMESFGIKGKLAPFFIKRTYNFAEKVIAVSDGVREDLIANYNVKPNKVITIYNAVLNNLFFDKANAEIESSIAIKIPSKSYLVAVGRLEIVKNFSFMLKAYAQLRIQNPSFDYDLVILGDGSEMDNLKKEVLELGLKDSVHLLGSISNPLPIIKKAKLFIHTSFSEAMPLVYVEALALKVPIVTVNNSGAEEVLREVEPKIIIPLHNQDEFIEGIKEMLNKSQSLNYPSLEEYKAEKIRDEFINLL